jgi:peroxiredoxin
VPLIAGEQAPHFTLKDTNEGEVSLNDYQGKWVVLYFYPKDNTSGCTTEALDFTARRSRTPSFAEIWCLGRKEYVWQEVYGGASIDRTH